MIRVFNQQLRVRFVILFVTVLVLSVFLPEADRSMREQATGEIDQTDYYMEHFTLTETDGSGEPLRSLKAENMSHFANGTTHLVKPQYRLIRSITDTRQWDISSDAGMLTGKTEAQLSGNVLIQRHLTQGNNETAVMTVNSDDLYIDLTRNIGETDNPVVVRAQSGTVSAIGMRVLFNEQQLQLHSEVRGRYEVH